MSDARPPRPAPLDVLAAAAEALAREPDLEATLGILLGSAADAVGASAGAVYVQDPDRVSLEPLLAVGIPESDVAGLRDGLSDAADPVAAVARGRVPAAMAGDAAGAFGRASASAAVSLRPLVTSRGGIDVPNGVLAIGWAEPHAPADDEERFLAAIADLAAVAVDRSRLGSLATERAEWLERVAHSDPLTGLANQRTFARVLELELARAGRQGGEVSVAVVDVDGIRETNERAGHEAGDRVLRAVAAVLAESVRLVDTVARNGGDDFVVVAPGSAGMTVARRVLSAVERLGAIDGRPVSVSIGVARFPTDGTSSEELLASAWRALEAARGAGPGRIVEATPQPAA